MTRNDDLMSNCSKTIDDIQQQMIGGGLASVDSIVGCTNDEIQTLENQYHFQLPAMYRTFLARMGHGAGDFFVGTDWTYPYLSHLRSAAESLIAESNASYRLPNDAFVFAMHQGYSFLFFHVTSDDPPVWLFVEYDKQPKEVAPSFSSWLRETVKEDARWKAKFSL